MSFAAMRLGRLPHNPARVAAIPRHHFAADAPPPPRCIRAHIPFVPGMYGNDTQPNCTAVTVFNAARAREYAQFGCDTPVADGAASAFYAACVGCADTAAAIVATDGAEMLDVMERATALGIDAGQQVPLVPTVTRIDLRDRAAMAHAIVSRGAVALGVDLCVADQTMDGGWNAHALPGAEWGGHALFGWDYTGLGDDDEVRLGTWGMWQPATWGWIDARAEEVYALEWRQLAGPAVG